MTSPTQPDEALRKKIEHIRKCYYNSLSPDDGTRYDGFGSMNSEQFTHNFLTLIATEVQAAQNRWWITTDFFSNGGQKIIGPFESKELAYQVRKLLENNPNHRTYAVDTQLSPIAGEGGKK